MKLTVIHYKLGSHRRCRTRWWTSLSNITTDTAGVEGHRQKLGLLSSGRYQRKTELMMAVDRLQCRGWWWTSLLSILGVGIGQHEH